MIVLFCSSPKESMSIVDRLFLKVSLEENARVNGANYGKCSLKRVVIEVAKCFVTSLNPNKVDTTCKRA